MLRRMVKKDAESFLNNETIILRFNQSYLDLPASSVSCSDRVRSNHVGKLIKNDSDNVNKFNQPAPPTDVLGTAQFM